VDLFREAAGRKLSSIECHDLCCKIAQIVVVGGVRRSALISLSNLTDDRLRRCKHGQWWVEEPQRGLANNSACYTEKPDLRRSLTSGLVYMNHDLVNEVCFLEWQVKSKLQETNEEMLPMILELIHVARSSYGLTNSAIYQKLLLGQPIRCQTSNEKYVLRLSLELYRLPSLTSDT